MNKSINSEPSNFSLGLVTRVSFFALNSLCILSYARSIKVVFLQCPVYGVGGS